MVLDAEILCRVIETGSFSRAAQVLGLTASAVSRRVGTLENNLGVKLFQRSTRALIATDAARSYYEKAREGLSLLAAANDSARGHSHEIHGAIRLHAPATLGRLFVARILRGFLTDHPNVTINLFLDDRPVHVLESGLDLSLAIDRPSGLATIVRKIGALGSVLCVSSKYLQAHPEPISLETLSNHNCLTFEGGRETVWRFVSDGVLKEVAVDGNFKANSSEALADASEAGLGVARLPEFLARPRIGTGRLTEILANHRMATRDLMIVYPERAYLPLAQRALIDHLAEALIHEQQLFLRTN